MRQITVQVVEQGHIHRLQLVGHLLLDAIDVDPAHRHQPAVVWIARAERSPSLGGPNPAGHGHCPFRRRSRGHGYFIRVEGDPPPIYQNRGAPLPQQGGDHVEPGGTLVDLTSDQDLVIGLKDACSDGSPELEGLPILACRVEQETDIDRLGFEP